MTTWDPLIIAAAVLVVCLYVFGSVAVSVVLYRHDRKAAAAGFMSPVVFTVVSALLRALI